VLIRLNEFSEVKDSREVVSPKAPSAGLARSRCSVALCGRHLTHLGPRCEKCLAVSCVPWLSFRFVHIDATETQQFAPASPGASEEMTMQEFADLLHVSRPFAVLLLETGEGPCHDVGGNRFVLRSDALNFKLVEDASRYAAARALTAVSEELGLYD
jgi:hypothetical protein